MPDPVPSIETALLLLWPAAYNGAPLNFADLASWLLTRQCAPGVRLLLALAACVANALAVGFGGSVHARYSARLVWLLPFGAMVALLHVRFGGAAQASARAPDEARSPSESGRAATHPRFS